MSIIPSDPANPDEMLPERCEHFVPRSHYCAQCARAAVPEAPLRGGHPGVLAFIDGMRYRHVEKSRGYGTGDDPLANFTAVAAVSGRPRCEYPIDRIIEKCTRMKSLIQQGNFNKLAEEFEDIGGLAACGHAMNEEDDADTVRVGPRHGG